MVASVTDAYSTPSRTNTVVYDTYGRFVTSATDAASLTTTYNYRSDGLLLKKTDPNGLVTSTSYSTGGSTQRSTTTLPDGNTVTSSLGWAGSGTELYYTRKQVSNGNTVASYFNAVGWKKRETSQGFNGYTITTTMEYLDNGSLSTVTDNDGNTTTYDYTETYSRLHSVTGLNTNIGYSYSTNSTTESDKSFSPVHTKTSTVDAFGNVTQVSGTNGTVVYNYYGSGKVKDVTAGGATTSMTYDDMGNQLTLVEPNSGTTSYTYNGFGQLKTQTDAKNQVTTMGYDAAGRCTTKTAGTIVETYTYSTTPGTKGLLLSTDRASTVQKSYTYDRLCRVKTVTTSGPVTPGPPTGTDFVTTYTYNNAGQVGSIAYPTGLTVSYVYDAVGNLKQINNASDNTRIWSGDGQNARGQWTQYSLGYGITTTWEYDETYKMLKSIRTGVAGNATSIQNLGFVFNEHGQLTSRTDGSLSETFQYDDKDRLTLSQVAGKTAYTYTYQASGKPDNGNIYQTTLNGTYHYDLAAHPHAVSSVDGVANYTSASNTVTTSISYLPDNKIVNVTNYTSIIVNNSPASVVHQNTISYGDDGNRFRVDFYSGLNSATLQFSKVYVDNNEFGYNSSGVNTFKRTIIYAPTGVCAVYEENGGVKSFNYIHTDYLGSWLAITDASGSVTNRYSYDAWDRLRDAGTWALKTIDITYPTDNMASMQPRFDRGYTGHETMWGLGFINMNGRVYDPYTQRFLSPDPYVQFPGNAQNYNRYAYCMNNPLRYTDPSGYTLWSRFCDWVGGTKAGKIFLTVVINVTGLTCLFLTGGAFGWVGYYNGKSDWNIYAGGWSSGYAAACNGKGIPYYLNIGGDKNGFHIYGKTVIPFGGPDKRDTPIQDNSNPSTNTEAQRVSTPSDRWSSSKNNYLRYQVANYYKEYQNYSGVDPHISINNIYANGTVPPRFGHYNYMYDYTNGYIINYTSGNQISGLYVNENRSIYMSPAAVTGYYGYELSMHELGHLLHSDKFGANINNDYSEAACYYWNWQITKDQQYYDLFQKYGGYFPESYDLNKNFNFPLQRP